MRSSVSQQQKNSNTITSRWKKKFTIRSLVQLRDEQEGESRRAKVPRCCDGGREMKRLKDRAGRV